MQVSHPSLFYVTSSPPLPISFVCKRFPWTVNLFLSDFCSCVFRCLSLLLTLPRARTRVTPTPPSHTILHSSSLHPHRLPPGKRGAGIRYWDPTLTLVQTPYTNRTLTPQNIIGSPHVIFIPFCGDTLLGAYFDFSTSTLHK